MSELVRTTKTEYLLYIDRDTVGKWYHISKRRCSTREQFDDWIRHLIPKNWFTESHAEAFEKAWKEAE